MSSAKSSKVKRLVNKAKHSSSLLARQVESLHSRFNLRRVILAADRRSLEKGQGRSAEVNYSPLSHLSCAPLQTCMSSVVV